MSASLVIGSDILGKHTIPELRNLVSKSTICFNVALLTNEILLQVGVLQDDCKNKKNELQLMVLNNNFFN